MKQLDLQQVQQRLANSADVHSDEVVKLSTGTQQERQHAALAILKTRLRQSLDAAGSLAAAQEYADQSTLDLIQKLSPLADDELVPIEVLKRLGIQRAKFGDFDEAMKYLQSAVQIAERVGQRPDARSRSALHYLHDEEIDRALGSLASRFAPPTQATDRNPRALAILVAALVEDNAPTATTLIIAKELRARGLDVQIVSIEYAPSNPVTLERFRSHSFDVTTIEGASPSEKILRTLEHFSQVPVTGTMYLGTPTDNLSKIVSQIRVSPAQFFMNICYEPHVGDFDLVFQTVSRSQEQITAWPGQSKFVGSFVGIAPQIEAATPFDRTALGVASDAIVFSTFGRLVKCSANYIRAVRSILEAEPRAELLLAGPLVDRELAALNNGFAGTDAGKRVHVLGPRKSAIPQLLKTSDIYLDSFPWPGGQSVLEAMWAGLPVVAMHGATEKQLDPLSVGPTSSTTESFLPPGIPLAPASDPEAYVNIALTYARNPPLRKSDGSRIRAHVMRENALAVVMDRMYEAITEKMNEFHAPAATTD